MTALTLTGYALLIAFLVRAWRRDAREARRVATDLAVGMTAAEIAADTLARAEAERRLTEWQAHVDTAFRAAMGDGGVRGRIIDRIAENEAGRIDGEWAELNGGRS